MQHPSRTNNVTIVYRRDLRSFEIRFELDNSDSNRKWRADCRTCNRTTNHTHCSTKNFNRCAVV